MDQEKIVFLRIGKIGDQISGLRAAKRIMEECNYNRAVYRSYKNLLGLLLNRTIPLARILNESCFNFDSIETEFWPRRGRYRVIFLAHKGNSRLVLNLVRLKYPRVQVYKICGDYAIKDFERSHTDFKLRFRNMMHSESRINCVIAPLSAETANNMSPGLVYDLIEITRSQWPDHVFNFTIVGVLSGEAERQYQVLADACKGVTNRINRTDIPELMRLLKEADFGIFCDSGPLHAAVELTPLGVAIFSARQPVEEWAPIGTQFAIINRIDLRCGHCMSSECKQVENVCVNSSVIANRYKNLVKRKVVNDNRIY